MLHVGEIELLVKLMNIYDMKVSWADPNSQISWSIAVIDLL